MHKDTKWANHFYAEGRWNLLHVCRGLVKRAEK